MRLDLNPIDSNIIGIGRGKYNLGISKSYSPRTKYDFYPFSDEGGFNDEYDAVVKALESLSLDKDNIGTENWNPFKDLISEGDTVVLKPNFVVHKLKKHIMYDVLLTSPYLVRAVLDFVHIALEDTGRIVIADSPLQGTRFREMVTESGFLKMVKEFQTLSNRKVEIIDLRKEIASVSKSYQIIKRANGGDPEGYVEVDIGDASMHKPIEMYSHKMGIGDYRSDLLHRNHRKGVHKYLISGTVLNADVVINLPKLKTHKYAGITCALKNLVGINCHKDSLPHYREGDRQSGGDQYPNRSIRKQIITKVSSFRNKSDFNIKILGPFLLAFNKLIKLSGKLIPFSDDYINGLWYGNDTIYRTVLDLNRIYYYSLPNGLFRDYPVRKSFTIVDALLSGQGYGPLLPEPYETNLVLAGLNNLAIDTLACKVLGLPIDKIPSVNEGYGIEKYPLTSFPMEKIKILDQGKTLSLSDFNGNAEVPHGWECIKDEHLCVKF